MFKEYFVCPQCGAPLVGKDVLQVEIDEGMQYCRKCGKNVASALTEALVEIQNSLQ